MRKFFKLLLVLTICLSFGQAAFAKEEIISPRTKLFTDKKIVILRTTPLIPELNVVSNCSLRYYIKDNQMQSALDMKVTLKNASRSAINITFPTSQQYDFVLYDKKKIEIYRWSKKMVFSSKASEITLKPDEEKVFSYSYTLYFKNDMFIMSRANYFSAEIPGKAEIVKPIDNKITVTGVVTAVSKPSQDRIVGVETYKYKVKRDNGYFTVIVTSPVTPESPIVFDSTIKAGDPIIAFGTYVESLNTLYVRDYGDYFTKSHKLTK